MTRRRLLLAGGLGALVVSAARPAASSPVEVDGTAYGGTASGLWTCGPSARVKYGGIGGEVRVRPSASHDAGAGETGETGETGFIVSLGAAGEHRDFARTDCGPSCNAATGVPPSGVALGSALKIGYDFRWLGVRAGALAWQNWASATDRGATWLFFPETKLRLGRLTGFHGELGTGSYGASTILRPGAWVGLAFVPNPGWEIAVHGGVIVTSGAGDNGGYREDLLVAIPVTTEVELGLAAAISEDAPGTVDPEGRMMLIAHVW
jgi:hypothetical protein